jgi:zinc/manganese transport system substrate-binding protein
VRSLPPAASPALRTLAVLLAVGSAVSALSLAACAVGTAGPATLGAGRVVRVAAAENFWGSIAAQVGGRHAAVVSIIASPNVDPHSYEPTAADARTLARARLVIENGVGYDPWAARLLAASGPGQAVLDVGELLDLRPDANPHRWYSPADVHAVVGAIAAALGRADPADRGYFARRAAWFDAVALRQYHALIAAIKSRYAGTPVGASESVFAMLAPALGLKLITPPSFLRAISEGTEVSAADKLTIDHQIAAHLISVYVYNSQNVTPDVRAQVAQARAAGIPTATITETLTPAGASYQAWQVRQLRGIAAALATAARRAGH